jgi:hypothetical protein
MWCLAQRPGSGFAFLARTLLLTSAFLLGCAGTKPDAKQGTSADGSAARDGADGPRIVVRDDAAAGADRIIGGPALGDAACATQTVQPERLPLDMYFMMDSSYSMDELTTSTQSKWDAVKAAFISFVGDPQSAGMGVGIQYFPLIRPGVPDECEVASECGQFGPCSIIRVCSGPDTVVLCNQNSDCAAGDTCDRLGACAASGELCAPAGLSCGALGGACQALAGYCEGRDVCEVPPYAMPAVAVAQLPGAAEALTTSISQHTTDGITPTAPALSGGLQHVRSLAQASPGRRVILVLATDGFPSECVPTDINQIAALASAAAAATPSVATFVVGVFTPDEQAEAQANLDTLATAGGTGKAFLINTTQNVTQSFLKALNDIRTAAVACEYRIPTAPAGGQVDYYRVNVQFTTGSGLAVTIGNVPDRASCHPTLGGWYYDVNPASGGTPTTIATCDATCRGFRGEPNGKVDVLFGCRTEVIVP